MSCLGVILARGGSKGIPRKNIRTLAGLPLIAYTIRAALESKAIDKIVVSTDCDEIAQIAREYGAEVPFMRSAELAQDKTWSRDALKDAVLRCEEIYDCQWSYVMELPCIAPLRTARHINEAYELLSGKAVDSVTAVCRVWDKHPVRMKRIRADGYLEDFCSEFPEGEGSRRQELEQCYVRNGSIYAMTRECIVEQFSRHGKKCVPYIMEEAESVNIDTFIDFDLAEAYLREHHPKIKFDCPLDFPVDLSGLSVTGGFDATILVCNPGANSPYDGNHLSKFKGLKAVATPSTGVTHIDTDYCNKHNIKVYCLLDCREELDSISASAEFTWLLVLSAIRNFTVCSSIVHSGRWRDLDIEEACRGRELQGKTIGIVGFGRIGQRVARYAAAFDMNILWYDPYIEGVPVADLADLFTESDIVVVCPYLTESSRGMINYELLSCCKQGAIVVNTSRGEVMNQDDVCRAVREGMISYVCDVVNDEQHLGEFWDSDLYRLSREGRVLITPHVAGATVESQTKALQAIMNLLRREKWI